MIVPERVESTDGVSIAVYDFGGPTAPETPLLLLSHATGFCGAVWGPIAEHLTDTFRCVGLDYRAHGSSPIPDGLDLHWRGMGEDLLAVVDSMPNTGPRYAAGHSMGGAAIAIAELARPGTFDRAWSFEPILFPARDEEPAESGETVHKAPIVDNARRRRAIFDSKDAAFERYGSRPPLSLLHPDALRAYVDGGFEELADGTAKLRCDPEHEAQVYEHSICGAYERLDEVTIPFLAAASGDGALPAEAAVEIAANFEAFTLKEYPDLTHFGPLEQPERIADDIREWLLA